MATKGRCQDLLKNAVTKTKGSYSTTIAFQVNSGLLYEKKNPKAETALVTSYKQDINYTKYTLPGVKSNLRHLQQKAFIGGHHDVTLGRQAVPIYLTSSWLFFKYEKQ